MRNAVLITRPDPGAAETASDVTRAGFVPLVAPLLEIRPMTPRLPRPERIAAILLTSGNAAEAVPDAYHGCPVLTVGDATARRAEAAGFAAVLSAMGDGAALAALVRQRFQPGDGTLLLASGKGQGLALAAGLRAAGFRVIRRAVYAAVPVTRLPEPAGEALTGRKLRAVLFFSADTARCFARLVRDAGLAATLAGCEAITIGPDAAMALAGLPWSRIRVAAKPNRHEMLALLR